MAGPQVAIVCENGDVLYTACAIFIYLGNNAPQLCLKFGVGLFNMGVMSSLAVQRVNGNG